MVAHYASSYDANHMAETLDDKAESEIYDLVTEPPKKSVDGGMPAPVAPTPGVLGYRTAKVNSSGKAEPEAIKNVYMRLGFWVAAWRFRLAQRSSREAISNGR